MGKIKTEPEESVGDVEMTPQEGEELSYEQKVANCSIIAKPMAGKKLAKKCYKLVKKAVKHKNYIHCGLRDVQTRIRKGDTGLVIFAGDISPIDVMSHLPGVCENKNIPYCYIPSRKDLGAALGVKRGCLTVLVRPNPEYEEPFNDLKEELNHLAVAL